LANEADKDRAWADHVADWIIAVARTNPPESAADKMPAMVNASNVMVVSPVYGAACAAHL
jgi:hypothetical protein